MKKLFVIAALAASISPALALASSTDLTVTGMITPGACTPSFASGGNVDLGKIPAASLNKDTQTELMAHDISLQVTCSADAAVAIKVHDNQASTLLPGIEIDGVKVNGWYLYGLGEAAGKKIGGYGLRHGTPTIDGKPSTLMYSENEDDVWKAPTVSLVGRNVANKLQYSWGDSVAAGPAAGAVHTFPMSLIPVIGPTNDLPITADIDIDGSATFELVYI